MDKKDISEMIKAAAEALDLKNFKGDIVMYKHVEKEMNVAEGGIGEKHIHHHYAKEQEGEKTLDAEQQNEGNEDGVTNCDAIPDDCKEAVRKVIVPTFTLEGGVVLNSAQQIEKASKQIDLTSNVEVAMLMSVCIEVKAVIPAVTCTDFVRALIGMRIIAFTDAKAISRMAGGMTKKLNGSTRNGKKNPPLPQNHRQWPSDIRPIGDRLFETMRSQT